MDILLKNYSYLGNASISLSEAVHKCKNGDTLHLGGGTIEINNKCSVPQTYYLPRYSDEKKYYAVYMEDKRDITIDGDGANLVFYGDVSAFGFNNCENITLRNFTIDYKTPYFVQGLITKTNEEYFDVRYDTDDYEIKYDEKTCKLLAFSNTSDFVLDVSECLTNEIESSPVRPLKSTPDYFLCTAQAHPVYSKMSVLVETDKLSDNHFRYKFKNRSVHHNPGNYIVQANHERKNTNFHFLNCRNINMENINMYASASFGVVALLCNNINIKNVNSVIRKNSGRKLAVNADIFHLVNTSGRIEISDCVMENTFDDTLNIHSLFSVVKSKIDKKTLLIHFTYLAKKALNLYRAGEKVNMLTSDKFEKYKEMTVVKSEMLGENYLRIEFDSDISDVNEGDFIESEDAKPEVYIKNCSAGNNRGRGFLVPTGRNTVVENCKFYCGGAAIAGNGASALYLEGSAINGLKVHNNIFADCARKAWEFPININPVSLSRNRTAPYHKNISICGNEFIRNGKKLIHIECSEDINIKNNKYVFDADLPEHNDVNETGIELVKCDKIKE